MPPPKNKNPSSQIVVQSLENFFMPTFGAVTRIKVYTNDYQQLSWRQVWDAFTEVYPSRWAIEMYPPGRDLVDEANVYHLWLMPVDWIPPPCMNLAENYR